MLRIVRLSSRFSAKIILTLLLVILIPTIFTSLSFYWTSESILKKNVRESAVQIAKQAADSLSSTLNVGNDTSDLIYSDHTIQRAVIHLNSSTPIEHSSLYQEVNSKLNYFVYSNSKIKSVYILKEEGSGWGSGNFSDFKLKGLRLSDQKWAREAKRKDGGLVWQGIQYDRFSGSSKTDLVLSVGRVMKDFDTSNPIGFLQISLNGREILSTIEQLKLGQTGKFIVVDSEGRVMVDSDLTNIGKKVEHAELNDHIVNDDATEFEFARNGVPYYGVKQLLSNGWMIVGTVPIKEITGQLDWIRTRILLSSGLFGLLTVGIGLFIAGWVTEPVKRLTQGMLLVQQGKLDVRMDVRSSDELGFLSKQFNNMLYNIQHLMRQVENEQSEKYHAELRAVMHRIHPHFLFNTLNTLRLLIKTDHKHEAYQGLSSLTRLLEANMGKSGSMITVEEELDLIRRYMDIMELLYAKTYTLELEVQPGMEKLVIPRMLLQPLVENAIFHGIVPKNADGRITIRISGCDGNAEFLVHDDGMGIEEGMLKKLNEPETAADGEIGIGWRHIYDTIRLYYAQGSKWSVTSSPKTGTTVRILLKGPEKTTPAHRN